MASNTFKYTTNNQGSTLYLRPGRVLLSAWFPVYSGACEKKPTHGAITTRMGLAGGLIS